MKNWPIVCLLSLILGVSVTASADPSAIVDGPGHVVNVAEWDGRNRWQPPVGMLAVADPKNNCTARANLFAKGGRTFVLYTAAHALHGPDMNLTEFLGMIAGAAGQGA